MPNKPAWTPTGKPNEQRAPKNKNRQAPTANTGQPADPSAWGPYGDVIRGANDVAGDSQQIRDAAIRYGQNNPYARDQRQYADSMLSGDMSRNPWEQDAYNTAHNITNPMDEAFNALRGYLGGGQGQGQQPNGPAGGGSYNYSASMSANPSLWGGGSGQGGGQVPDTVGGQNSFFAQQIRALFDAQRLDPANDPTMRPMLDAMRRESSENMYASMQDLSGRAEGSGLFGSGSYNALMNRAREEGMESLDSSTAQMMLASREGALARQMQGLDMTNTRDLGAMQDATNRYGIDASSAASGAGQAAAAADAMEGRKLQAIQMMLGGGQDLLGFQGSMAGMRQQGQQDAVNSGLGFANLGMQGYQTGLAADQNRMSALDLIRGSLGNQQQYQLGQAQNATARAGVGVQRGQLNLSRANSLNDSAMNMMQMLSMLAGMGGTTTSTGGVMPPTNNSMDPNTAALLALLGGGASRKG